MLIKRLHFSFLALAEPVFDGMRELRGPVGSKVTLTIIRGNVELVLADPALHARPAQAAEALKTTA